METDHTRLAGIFASRYEIFVKGINSAWMSQSTWTSVGSLQW